MNLPESPHTIRLHGPWQLTLKNAGEPIYKTRVNVRPGEPWEVSCERSLAKYIHDNSESAGPLPKVDLFLTRVFKWPSPEPAPKAVYLCLESVAELNVTIHDQVVLKTDALATEEDRGIQRWDVQAMLQERNQLVLHFEGVDLVDLATRVNGVHLEIF